MKKFNVFLTIIPALIIIALTGCGSQNNGQNSQKPQTGQQQSQNDQQSDKVPEQLKSLEGNIEKIIVTLNGPAVSSKDDASKGNTQQEKSSSQGQSGQSQKSGQEEQGSKGGQESGKSEQGGGQAQGGQSNAQKQQDPFEAIVPIINSMHYQWNNFLPISAKKGASKALIDNFSSALNSLTTTSIGKNKTNTLMAASQLYAYIPDFYSLYDTKTSPEIKRVRYYTRNATLNAMAANWLQAEADMGSLKSSWALFKNTIPKDKLEDANKMDFSIYELERVIKDKNQPLSDIKGRVSMSNLEALEKASSEGSENPSKSSEKEVQSNGDS